MDKVATLIFQERRRVSKSHDFDIYPQPLRSIERTPNTWPDCSRTGLTIDEHHHTYRTDP